VVPCSNHGGLIFLITKESALPMKLLITGLPRSGKSTLLERLINEIPHKRGFVTTEIREGGERTGFQAVTDTGHKQILSSIHIASQYKVPRSVGGTYNVDVDAFDRLLSSLFDHNDTDLLYIDEIGRMELFSERFKELVNNYLIAPNNFIGTIPSAYDDEFIMKVKARTDVMLIEITPENRERKYEEIRKILGI
jgi:nucleoside-triphosphatase THEP1